MGGSATGSRVGPIRIRRNGEEAPGGFHFAESRRTQGGGTPGSARPPQRSAAAHLPSSPRVGGDRDGARLTAGSRTGGRQRDEKYLLEEPQGRSSIYQSSGAQQHSAIGERLAGPP